MVEPILYYGSKASHSRKCDSNSPPSTSTTSACPLNGEVYATAYSPNASRSACAAAFRLAA
jgi:hypothetical protein